MYIQNGYGFVHFPLTDEGVKSALQAVSALHQVTINHITYDCSISNQLRQVLAQMERDRNGGVNSRSSHGAAPMMQNQFPRNVMPKMASGGSYYGNRNVGYNMPEPQASYVPSTTYSNRFPRGMMDNKAHYSDAQQQAPGNEYYQTDFAASNQYETSSVHSGHWSGASSIFSHASTSSSTNNPSPVPTFRDINGPVPGMHGSFNYSDPAPIPGSAREFFRGAEFQQNFEQQFEQLNMNSGFPMASDSRPRNSSSPSQVLDNISVTSNLSGGNEAPKLSSSLNTSVLTDNIFLFESNASVRERATTSDGNFPLGPPRYLSNSSVSTVDLSSSWNGTSQTSLLADSLDEFDSQITLKAWKTEVSQPSTDETVRSGSNFDAQLEALCSEN